MYQIDRKQVAVSMRAARVQVERRLDGKHVDALAKPSRAKPFAGSNGFFRTRFGLPERTQQTVSWHSSSVLGNALGTVEGEEPTERVHRAGE